MPNFYDLRCELPATYRPGKCDQLLLRVTSTGGLELKCHNCRRVQVVHRSQWEQATNHGQITIDH